MLRQVWLILLFLVPSSHALDNWPSLSSSQDDAWRAQRDVEGNIPLDQLGHFGASLNELIFEPLGYNTNALSQVSSLLDVKTSAILVDLYWNEFTQVWQLCPAPFPNNLTSNLSATVDVTWQGRTYQCQPGLSVSDLMSTIAQYLRYSNIKLNANIVLVLLNLKSIYYEEQVTTTGYNRTTNTTISLAASATDSVPSDYDSNDIDYLTVGNYSLNVSVSGLGSYLFTPSDMNSFAESGLKGNYTKYYSSQYPTLYDFLFNLYKRVMVMVHSDDVHVSSLGYNLTSSDKTTIFFRNLTRFDPTYLRLSNSSLLENCSARLNSPYNSTVFVDTVEQTHFRYVVDSKSDPFTNSSLHQWSSCGYTPILNSSYSAYADSIYQGTNITSDQPGMIINNFVVLQYWSWAKNQPDISSDDRYRARLSDLVEESDDHDDENQIISKTQIAYNCVTMNSEGWVVSNCYDKYKVACQNNSDPFDWTLLTDLTTYLDIESDGRCGENYTRSLPKLSIEQNALLNLIKSENILSPVWIDLNDVTITGCFVSGGPYAECPYKRVVTTLNLIKRIAPSVVVAFIILLLVFYEKFFLLVPVHTNRKRYWKRTITQYYKENEYEGVPS